LIFLLGVPASELELAHRPESLRGSPLIKLDSLIDHLDLEKIFGRNAPLHVDLGCGDGGFLCALAQRMPDENFLGIKRLSRRVERTCRKAEKVDNMRVLNAETSYVVRYLLPENSVETFYRLFPDPWPKRRRQRRRIFFGRFFGFDHRRAGRRRTFACCNRSGRLFSANGTAQPRTSAI